MADMAVAQDAPKTRSKGPLLVGLVLALALGGGGFYATYAGLVPLPARHASVDLPAIAFVPLEPTVISLGRESGRQHLRFTAELEVAPEYEAEVALLKPRVLDVLNGYLRAVSVEELEDPAELVRLRAQMLRRVQMVTGEGRVRDLLVTEFVIN
ncbi:flagellar basal body-associated protein FliL [Falsirhodobacter algicola]|uniref:Flagellar protein FliL n=1 Tax=Falsirhodobacter algicola TaxID=2692330 RepID=A0A8J8MT99_9RHOB|nr:flagellar basal body-associated FliL family protein [Falsirhodobacter algicola]QUS35918.1 flagellar basal body protein FliL [Falsirhodobacter algicola]